MKGIAVYPGKMNSSHIVEIDTPIIGSDEVLVKVLQVGIDGTDSEIDEGLYGDTPSGCLFLIIGHESFGIVEDVGSEVGDLKKGDYVVSTVRRPCKECINCKNGESDMCLTGNYLERGIKGLHGFMADYYKEVSEFLVKVSEKHRRAGVLLEPLSIVEKAILQSYKIQERTFWEPRNALVLGAGPIGLLATMVLRNMDLEVYTVATREKNSLKAKLVEETGAYYINAKKEPTLSIKENIGSFDLIIEATGSSKVAFESMQLIETNGILCLTSITGGNKMIEVEADKLNIDLVLGNKTVYGMVNSNRNHFEAGIQHYYDFEEKWPTLLERMITRKEPFEKFKEAMKKDPEDIKTILEISR